jgi:glucose/arabinose dehydrogenase
VPQPSNAQLSVPPGFEVTPFAAGIEGARQVRVAPNGDVFVTSQQSGRVFVLRSPAGASKVSEVQTFAEGLKQPFGIAFFPSGSRPQWVYIAEENRVVRFAYQNGDLQARGNPQTVVDPLAPETGGHGAHDLLFSRDGKQFFVAVGSASDAAATGLPRKTNAEIAAWESEHGLGAAWGAETGRADIMRFDAGSGASRGLYATGIRNCGTMALRPASGELWCVSTERNQLGDDLAPDYLTRVREGAFYGWPWYYTGAHEDPRHQGERPDLADKVTAPDVLFTPHSAPLSLTFYTATRGVSVFPKSYRGDVFVAMHGSWNRSRRAGHKVVRVHVKDGVPTGDFEDFLTGFVVDDSTAWGRPVAVAVASDGALLVSDDAGGVIWRVAPRRAP